MGDGGRDADGPEIGDENGARRRRAGARGRSRGDRTMRPVADRRLQGLEDTRVVLAGPGTKRSRNIGVAGFDDADIRPSQRSGGEDQQEEQRDPREK